MLYCITVVISSCCLHLVGVVERARSRSNSRTRSTKRSRSSPPSSRRTTRDDFPTVTREEPLTSCYSESGSLHSIPDMSDRQQPEKVRVFIGYYSSVYYQLDLFTVFIWIYIHSSHISNCTELQSTWLCALLL